MDEEIGLTLRDYFAAQALIGLSNLNNIVPHDPKESKYDQAARMAYAYADAMLEEKAKSSNADTRR